MESYLTLFKMPIPMKITSRSSVITHAFISSIIPVIVPSNLEVKKALGILGMHYDNICCVYCGDATTEWDHLRALVLDKRPTGYISEIQNLVPACGKCNQSKGNRGWAEWIVSDAKLSPKSRGIVDIKLRMNRLTAYSLWRTPTIIDFEAILGKEQWAQHWANCEIVQYRMRQAQEFANQINRKVANSL